MEADVASGNHPEPGLPIEGSIGELSPLHKTAGFSVDGVDMGGIVLPEGWRERLG